MPKNRKRTEHKSQTVSKTKQSEPKTSKAYDAMKARFDCAALNIIRKRGAAFVTTLDAVEQVWIQKKKNALWKLLKNLPRPDRDIIFAYVCLQAFIESTGEEATDLATKTAGWLSNVEQWNSNVNVANAVASKISDKINAVFAQTKETFEKLLRYHNFSGLLRVDASRLAARKPRRKKPITEAIELLCTLMGTKASLTKILSAFGGGGGDKIQDVIHSTNPSFPITVVIDKAENIDKINRVLHYCTRAGKPDKISFHRIENLISDHKKRCSFRPPSQLTR